MEEKACESAFGIKRVKMDVFNFKDGVVIRTRDLAKMINLPHEMVLYCYENLEFCTEEFLMGNLQYGLSFENEETRQVELLLTMDGLSVLIAEIESRLNVNCLTSPLLISMN